MENLKNLLIEYANDETLVSNEVKLEQKTQRKLYRDINDALTKAIAALFEDVKEVNCFAVSNGVLVVLDNEKVGEITLELGFKVKDLTVDAAFEADAWIEKQEATKAKEAKQRAERERKFAAAMAAKEAKEARKKNVQD